MPTLICNSKDSHLIHKARGDIPVTMNTPIVKRLFQYEILTDACRRRLTAKEPR